MEYWLTVCTEDHPKIFLIFNRLSSNTAAMKRILLLLLISTLIFINCKRDDDEPLVEACFTFAATDLNVTFNSECSEGANSYQWQLGDGTTSNEANPTHQYSSAGDYTVTLTATSSSGATDTKTQTITL